MSSPSSPEDRLVIARAIDDFDTYLHNYTKIHGISANNLLTAVGVCLAAQFATNLRDNVTVDDAVKEFMEYVLAVAHDMIEQNEDMAEIEEKPRKLN
jgi:hypothetical protein